MHLGSKDKIFIGSSCLFFVAISAIGWLIWGEIILIVSLVMMLAILLTIQIQSQRSIQKQLRDQRKMQQQLQKQWFHDYRQIEALFSLFSSLKITHPLPPMRVWAISPDFANTIVLLILEHKPKLILEAGSGVSSIVAAYCLQEIGQGTIISLEHDKQFATTSANNLAKHGLQDITTVIHAPLQEIDIQNKTWLWYDTEQLKKIESIDMLIIDGPPRKTHPLARYPALPILFDLLSDNAVILLDDGSRADEKETVDLWLKEFDCFEQEAIHSEKGTIILYKTKYLIRSGHSEPETSKESP